ncbi:MAG: hypothetical protein Q6351_004820 [Candidatus Njordarchaeum guaymaensis]
MIRKEEKELLDYIAKLQLMIKREKNRENKEKLKKILQKKISQLYLMAGGNDDGENEH